MQQTAHRVSDEHAVIERLDDIFVAFRDSVSFSRGYAPDAVQLHRQSLESIQSAVQDVRQRTVNRPEQRQRIISLQAALDQVIALERRRLGLVARNGVGIGDTVFREGHGDVFDDRIRRIIAEMKSSEDSFLLREQQEQERRMRTANEVFSSSLALGVLILFAVYYQLEREIGWHQRSESRLIHLNRLYVLLSQTNQAIIRVRSREELFREMCRIAVEHGQFVMAWIGVPEPGSGLINPVAWWGREDGYLRNSQISTADEPQGRGPTGSAIPEGRRFVCNDIASDPCMPPSHDEALRRGYHSSSALPIKVEERLVGTFTVYADQPGFFDDEILRLLEEVTSDISFALHTIHQDEQRRNAEAEIRRLNEELEQRITERTAQLGEANRQLAKQNEELARASRMKSEFLARMSHEFRTPLNSIIGFTDLLAEQGEGALGDVYADYVLHVHDGAHHLLALVNDILDLSRIEAGRIDLRHEEFSALDAMSEVLSAVSPLAEVKKIELRSEALPALAAYGDRTRFKQILYNLLSNAVKFTPTAGRVQVSAEPDYGEIRFCVSDSGIGIPPDQQTTIFEEFTQLAPASSGVKEGAGLGLAITKRIVELHGGRIWVDSTPGEGSRFFFSMAAAPTGKRGLTNRLSSTA